MVKIRNIRRHSKVKSDGITMDGFIAILTWFYRNQHLACGTLNYSLSKSTGPMVEWLACSAQNRDVLGSNPRSGEDKMGLSSWTLQFLLTYQYNRNGSKSRVCDLAVLAGENPIPVCVCVQDHNGNKVYGHFLVLSWEAYLPNEYIYIHTRRLFP